jgi:hypothetical protein
MGGNLACGERVGCRPFWETAGDGVGAGGGAVDPRAENLHNTQRRRSVVTNLNTTQSRCTLSQQRRGNRPLGVTLGTRRLYFSRNLGGDNYLIHILFFFYDFLKKVAQKIFRDAHASHPCAKGCFSGGGRFLKTAAGRACDIFCLFTISESELSRVVNKQKIVALRATRRFQKQRAGENFLRNKNARAARTFFLVTFGKCQK